jgi:ferritin
VQRVVVCYGLRLKHTKRVGFFPGSFEHVYVHVQMVTGLINDLVDLAIELKDHATNNFLQWFVAEQVEEEESASGVLQKVKMAGESGRALYMLDQELAQRVFHPPTDE